MRTKIFILSMLLPVHLLLSQNKTFYYTFDGKIELTVKSDKIAVKLPEGTDIKTAQEFIEKFRLSKDKFEIDNVGKQIYTIKSDEQSISSFLSENTASKQIKTSFSVYTTTGVDELVQTNEIVLKFKPGVSYREVNDIIEKNGLKKIKGNSLYQVFKVPERNDGLLISNKIFESGLVEYSHPDFLIKIESYQHIPDDEYFYWQITCNNTGQTINDNHTGSFDADIDAPHAWDFTKGDSNIIIAVIDHGVTSDHSDLPNSRQVRLDSSNFASLADGSDVNDPSPVGNYAHGNACAGVIAATMDNSEGIAGIVPLCKIMPVRIPLDGVHGSTTDVSDAIKFAVDNGAKIISNSWGLGPYNPNYIPVWVNAIQYAVDHNRVILFAAGNTAHHAHEGWDGYVSFPSNVLIDGVITVGASDRYDFQANYSPTSDVSSPNNQIIDIVAPSHRAYPDQIAGENGEMWTLDIPGPAGYNYSRDRLPVSGTNYLSYTGRFGGTSHATPVVASVAALILSMDPSLTNLEVFDILMNSTDKVGGYSYDYSGWSNEMGFGRVNAFKAIMATCPDHYTINWPIGNEGDLEYKAGEYIVANNTIQNIAPVSYHARDSVKLTIGFHAAQSSNFSAGIRSCGTNLKSTTPGHDKFINPGETHSERKINDITGEEGNLYLFPNPSTGVINITLINIEAPVELEIYDIAGTMLFKKMLYTISGPMDISHLQKGIYVLKVNGEKNVFTKKLILK